MKRGKTEYSIGRARYGVMVVFFLFLGGILLTAGCKKETEKELLIYCGMTMIKPVSEIVRIIEEQEGCKILVVKGGSGNLLKSIEFNRVGDLYLPGSENYITICLEKNLVTDTALVGYNKAALMVRKGNPKGITEDLSNLASKEYSVVIGNPDSGSIGSETKSILEKKGIYNEVAINALKMATDSKELVRVLKEKEADIVINWYAVATWPENISYIDTFDIPEKYAERKKLVIGLLKTSKYPRIARAFMECATSEQGQKLFEKYGLYVTK